MNDDDNTVACPQWFIDHLRCAALNTLQYHKVHSISEYRYILYCTLLYCTTCTYLQYYSSKFLFCPFRTRPKTHFKQLSSIMKVYASLLCLSATSAFLTPQIRRDASSLAASTLTGAPGKPATSAEEDLKLTLQIIMDHEDRSATVSKEQFISQMEESGAVDGAPIDISVPYDAAARLAYEESDKAIDYEAFKEKYEAETIAMVKSKQPIDISIPYDAPARLAYEESDKSMSYLEFKVKYEAETIEMIKSKQPIDISIPYDAPARLAYEESDKSMSYLEFKVKYEAETIEMIKSKQPIDISIPYDAPARLAYEESDKSMPYPEFKVKYEAETIAMIKSKQPIDVSIPYDAPARLAYENSDKSMAYEDFKAKYEADAVAEVKAKQAPKVSPTDVASTSVDISIPYDAPARMAYERSDKAIPYAEFKQKYEAGAVADVIAKRIS